MAALRRPDAAAPRRSPTSCCCRPINRFEPLSRTTRSRRPCIPRSCFACACRRQANWPRSPRPRSARRPSPGYRHDRLRESFEPVIAALRASLSAVLEQRAIPIPIESKKYRDQCGHGRRSQPVHHGGVRAGRARRSSGRGAAPAVSRRSSRSGRSRRFASSSTCSSRACRCTPMPVAPRQIPFHAGFVYFELDQSHELWATAPDLWRRGVPPARVSSRVSALEFWAIRG